MNKWVMNLMGIICIALAAVFFYERQISDHQPPVIRIPDTEITYTDDMDKTALLEGVTAVDDKDGDVTKFLIVEEPKIIPSKDGAEVVVTYVAKDSSNNIVKKERKVSYNTQESSDGVLPEDGQNAGGEDQVSPEDAARQAAETDALMAEMWAKTAHAELPSGSPLLVLSVTAVTVQAGQEFSPLQYVKQITDDTTSEERLYGNIQVSDDYDVNTPGTYQVYYRVTDEDGNPSNLAALTLNVTQ